MLDTLRILTKAKSSIEQIDFTHNLLTTVLGISGRCLGKPDLSEHIGLGNQGATSGFPGRW